MVRTTPVLDDKGTVGHQVAAIEDVIDVCEPGIRLCARGRVTAVPHSGICQFAM